MELRITVTAQQLGYMREMMRHGLWGPDIQAVGENLLVAGLRDAARDGFVTLTDSHEKE